MKKLACIVAVLLVACVAHAERLDQPRREASLIVVGKVTKLVAKDNKYNYGRVLTTYTATVEVDQIEKGEADDTITVTWYCVTKQGRRPTPGPSGQDHKLKENDVATFWLFKMKGKHDWNVIYNYSGVEKVKE